ncbi:tripartite tricarboxylate transporter permease [Pelagibacterium sediminicola]|uniref:tripartite tricarboxylate transporter permease n=1 Tax=Pelagibacterium sediminicola TaxID=2248761 RepID=UPI000E3240A3|nr:tripartite tricarboxylate transporter permease [Pelagibacterium sediminicola]
MDFVANLTLGLQTAMTLENLIYAGVGCLLGTLIGVLPGLGPLTTISMLLPFTFGLSPIGALIMLAGIYYGAAYGGSTTAILVNLPGEASSVVTTIDGHQMAKQGRAGAALAAAAIGSFVAGSLGVLVLAVFSGPIAQVAFSFGPAEYFALMFMGLIGAVSLTSGPLLKSLCMIVVGLLIGLVGMDVSSGVVRFSFGSIALWEGVDFIVISIGIFAFAEIVSTLERQKTGEAQVAPIASIMPTRQDIKRMTPAILRGSTLGSFLGILPGAGVSLASFFAYSLEKKTSKYRHELGKGAIEGVAGPESANNAAAQTSFIPTLTLGIPGSATMALMLGAMVIHNIQPGPSVVTRNPDLFWGLIVSMWIGNLFLVILNLPLIGMWVRLLRIPYSMLFPAILMFCCIGVYASSYSVLDVFMVAGLGAAGYVLAKLDCEPAPLLLGFILGPMVEEYFRRALVLSDGDFSVFVSRPISAALLAVSIAMLVFAALPKLRKARQTAFAED